jgi:hypothetical protein
MEILGAAALLPWTTLGPSKLGSARATSGTPQSDGAGLVVGTNEHAREAGRAEASSGWNFCLL